MNGRFQPFDSVARNSLLQIRTKQTVYETGGGKARTLSAMDWLLEVMMKPEAADDLKIFRIDNNEVLALLKLPENQKYYSFNQLRPQMDEIEKQAERIDKIESASRTVFESQLMKLYEMMNLYQRLEISLKPPGTDDFAAELEAYQKSIGPGMAAVQARDAGQKFDQERLQHPPRLHGRLQYRRRFALPLTIPPADAEPAPRRLAKHRHQSHADRAHRRNQSRHTSSMRQWSPPTAAGQPADFNRAVAGYRPGSATGSRRR